MRVRNWIAVLRVEKADETRKQSGKRKDYVHPLVGGEAHLARKVVQVRHELLKDELLPVWTSEAVNGSSGQAEEEVVRTEGSRRAS